MKIVRIKKTRILVRSTRTEALRTIQYLISACPEDIRMVRKFQNFSWKSYKPKSARKITLTLGNINSYIYSTHIYVLSYVLYFGHSMY